MGIYLDNSATTRQYDQVTEKMMEMMREDFGNPSSLHQMGLNAEKALKKARKQLEDAMSVYNHDIYFTSGGTEGDNIFNFQFFYNIISLYFKIFMIFFI